MMGYPGRFGRLITIISLLILFSIPGYSLAAVEHSGHDSPPANSAKGHDSHTAGEGAAAAGKDMAADTETAHPAGHQAAPDSSREQHGADPGAHDNKGSGHEGQDAGHGDPGPSGLEPVRNLLVGGFAGINALIIGVALFLKHRLQRGATV